MIFFLEIFDPLQKLDRLPRERIVYETESFTKQIDFSHTLVWPDDSSLKACIPQVKASIVALADRCIRHVTCGMMLVRKVQTPPVAPRFWPHNTTSAPCLGSAVAYSRIEKHLVLESVRKNHQTSYHTYRYWAKS